jgi:hypothetical protein
VGAVKHCPKCDLDKPTEEFGKNRSRGDGLQPYCKPCSAEANRLRRERQNERQRMEASAAAQVTVDVSVHFPRESR